MKRIVYSICIGTLALALTAWGEEIKTTPNAKGKAKANSSASVKKATGGGSVRSAGQVRTQHSPATAGSPRFSQRSYNATPKGSSSAIVRQKNLRSDRVHTFRERNLSTNNQVRARNDVAINRERNLSVNRRGNLDVSGSTNVTTNRARSINRSVAVNNNWRSSQFSGQNYAAFRNYSRAYHNRYWWDSHYPRITFYFGAPYYWDAGYWYPAWGYYPGYAYQYDGPIYGYNGLAPDQVVVDVQVQLQRDGYYAGPIDGVLGPMTRRAITAFQADHGLAITSSIDEPTLATLGLS
jgi:hypothetical protein